jgi:muramoyltetrapeptide carboxypeptidase
MLDFSLPGVGVAIVAPSGYAPDEVAFARAVTKLQSYGCIVHNYYEPSGKFQRFGAPDQLRLAQLNAAAENPDVQIVLALRGGYGLSRVLPQIDFNKMAASGKLFVGQSDFTPFHIGLLRLGAVSFAGPMICNDFSDESINVYMMQQFRQCLYGPEHVVDVRATGNPRVDVTGTLWGGNLAMLTHIVGTPYMHVVDDGILFLEDIAEHPYRVERMILQLLYAGVLQRQKALILGDFSAYKLTDYDNGYNFDEMVAYLRSILPIPVLTGLPFGHIREKTTLAVGADAHLTSDSDAWRLTMRNYPTIAR